MKPRTTLEKVLITLGGFGFISVFPFGLIRLMRAEWLIGIIDITIALIMLVICAHVSITRRTHSSSFILAVLSIFGSLLSIFVQGESQVYWIYPAILTCYYLLSPKHAMAICILASAITIALIYDTANSINFGAIIITQLITNLFAYAFSKHMYDHQRTLTQQAQKDALTNIGNRRALDTRLEEIVAVQQRSPSNICLIILDIDHFKQINDQYGHRVGDEILVELVDRLTKRMRVTDALYRFGGEEFVIVPLPMNTDMAFNFAEDLRNLVVQKPFTKGIELTISLGIAKYNQNESHVDWLERADQALYLAKSQGRNCSRNAD